MDADKDQLFTKAQLDEAVAEALAKADKEKEEDIAKVLAKAKKDKEQVIAEAVKAKEKEIRYEMYQEMLAYRRRKTPCRNYVPRYGGWRTQ